MQGRRHEEGQRAVSVQLGVHGRAVRPVQRRTLPELQGDPGCEGLTTDYMYYSSRTIPSFCAQLATNPVLVTAQVRLQSGVMATLDLSGCYRRRAQGVHGVCQGIRHEHGARLHGEHTAELLMSYSLLTIFSFLGH